MGIDTAIHTSGQKVRRTWAAPARPRPNLLQSLDGVRWQWFDSRSSEARGEQTVLCSAMVLCSFSILTFYLSFNEAGRQAKS